ncbi:methionyl-tRNA formyltransferase [Patescibacteria group bacterium]|nr:methionyl-tRNA formyltransferase [Patescibacteria group bacterium]
MNNIKVIFISTPDFGLPSLEALINDKDFNIVSVITKSDKPVGRKQILTSPPIKQKALKNNISVLQPIKIKTIVAEIEALSPDIIIVVAYAQIIPQVILDIPKYGCINVHGSLLPKFRGASCIQAAILNGEKKTGVTIMKMDAGLDTGPILAQREVEIEPNWTSGDLYDKISVLGGEILAPTIKAYIAGEIQEKAQDNSASSYAKMLKKEDGLIDFNQDAVNVERFVRAMQPWPGSFTDQQIKILEVSGEILDTESYAPGDFFEYNNQLAVKCFRGALIVNRIQPVGKKIITGQEFLNGYKKYIKK